MKHLGISLIVALLALGPSTAVEARPLRATRPDGAAVFKPILAKLRTVTRVPVPVPRDLADEEESLPLHVTILHADQRRYDLVLGFGNHCEGGNSCRYGSMSASVRAPRALEPAGAAVRLAKGTTGYFVNGTCGAVCADSTMTWDRGAYRFTIGVKAASLRAMRRVANSAINSAWPPL